MDVPFIVRCLQAAFHNHDGSKAAHWDRIFSYELRAGQILLAVGKRNALRSTGHRTFLGQYELESDSRSDVTSMTSLSK
jgi:hypothetical protein